MRIKPTISLSRSVALARVIVVVGFIFWNAVAGAAEEPIKVNPLWSDIGAVVKTRVALQVCPEPPMFRGQPLHDAIHGALRDLKADYNRFQPWPLHPRVAVAELQAPASGKTYWDFTLMDQVVEDFMQAVDRRPVIFSVNVIPKWMYGDGPIGRAPAAQDAIDPSYGAGVKFSRALVKQFADYEARLAGWYLKGGFRDEYGRWHPSGHFFQNIEYWEPLNEPNGSFTPPEVSQLYDAVAIAVRKVVPTMKFAGPALANIDPTDTRTFGGNGRRTAEHFQYFMDRKHHRAGVPIDMLSYHIYTASDLDETPAERAHTLFANADAFLMQAYVIDVFKQQQMPAAKTAISELGTAVRPYMTQHLSVPESYWNLTAAVWAYLYANLTGLGIDAIDGAELIDYPGEWAGSTFIDWDTGKPKPVYWVLKMLKQQFHPGDRLVKNAVDDSFMPQALMELTPARHLYYQGFLTESGDKKILLINRSDQTLNTEIPGGTGGRMVYVDGTTGSQRPGEKQLESEQASLGAYAVAVIVLKQ